MSWSLFKTWRCKACLSVTLLHVVDVNIALVRPSVYDELCAEAEAALRKLAKLFFGTAKPPASRFASATFRDDIVAEAKAGSADMIVLGPNVAETVQPLPQPHHAACPQRRALRDGCPAGSQESRPIRFPGRARGQAIGRTVCFLGAG